MCVFVYHDKVLQLDPTRLEVQSARGPDGACLSPAWRQELLPLLLLSVVVVACNLAVVNLYFAADDFLAYSFWHEALNGHPEHFARAFTSAWMPYTPPQQYCFRPLGSAASALDLVIGGGSASACHWLQLAFYCATVWFVYLVGGELFRQALVESSRARLAAFTAALLFACYPLHHECVAWLANRVQVVADLGILAAFYCYLRARDLRDLTNSLWRWLSYLACTCAVLSKEHAILLPVVIAAHAIVFCSGAWTKRLRSAVVNAAPYMVPVTAYLAYRSFFLHLPLAPYYGAGYESQNLFGGIQVLLAQPPALAQIWFPADLALDSWADGKCRILAALYVAVFVLVWWRQRQAKMSAGLTAFVCFWSIAWVLPVLTIWHLTPDLKGGRHFFMASAGLAWLLPWLLVCPDAAGRPSWLRMSFSLRLSLAVLAAVAGIFASLTWTVNTVWVESSRQLLALKQAIRAYALGHPREKLVLVNTPQFYHGASILWLDSMVTAMLKPPFDDAGVSSRVSALTPFFCFRAMQNPAALRAIAAGHFTPLLFDRAGSSVKVLPPAPRPGQHKATELACVWTQAGAGTTHVLAIPANPRAVPSGVQAVTVKVRLAPAATKARVRLSWQGKHVVEPFDHGSDWQPAICDGAEHSYQFFVGQYEGWRLADLLTQLDVNIDAALIQSSPVVELKHEADLMPQLSVKPDTAEPSGSGTYVPRRQQVTFMCTAGRLMPTKLLVLEMLPKNYNIEQKRGSFADSSLSPVSCQRWTLGPAGGTVTVNLAGYEQGDYQFRLAALDARRQTIGCLSWPLAVAVAPTRSGPSP